MSPHNTRVLTELSQFRSPIANYIPSIRKDDIAVLKNQEVLLVRPQDMKGGRRG
jgi:hypothetical protein